MTTGVVLRLSGYHPTYPAPLGRMSISIVFFAVLLPLLIDVVFFAVLNTRSDCASAILIFHNIRCHPRGGGMPQPGIQE